MQAVRSLLFALLAAVAFAGSPVVHTHTREEGSSLAAKLLSDAAAKMAAKNLPIETMTQHATHSRQLKVRSSSSDVPPTPSCRSSLRASAGWRRIAPHPPFQGTRELVAQVSLHVETHIDRTYF